MFVKKQATINDDVLDYTNDLEERLVHQFTNVINVLSGSLGGHSIRLSDDLVISFGWKEAVYVDAYTLRVPTPTLAGYSIIGMTTSLKDKGNIVDSYLGAYITSGDNNYLQILRPSGTNAFVSNTTANLHYIIFFLKD